MNSTSRTCETMKKIIIFVSWSLKREKRWGPEKASEEIMTKNLPNLVKDINLQICVKSKKSMPNNIIIKLLKTKGEEKNQSKKQRNNALSVGQHQ